MNSESKDHLVDMINAIRCLQLEWTDIYVWSLDVNELEQSKQYEVTITTGSQGEASRLYLLLIDVTDLKVTLYNKPSKIICI